VWLRSPRPQKGAFCPASAAVLRRGTVVRVDVQLKGAAELCGVRRIQLHSVALVDSRRNGCRPGEWMSRAPRSAPPGRRKVRFTLHRSRFCGAERQVRVEADPRIGGAIGGPDYSILSPEFCGGETLAALALVSVDSRGIEKDASSTLGYGHITQLSEVPERSTP
jgi:hypothetical protein